MHKVAIICCSNILLFYQCVNRWQGNLMTLLQTQTILPYLLILSCTCDKVIRVMVQKLKYNIIKKKKNMHQENVIPQLQAWKFFSDQWRCLGEQLEAHSFVIIIYPLFAVTPFVTGGKSIAAYQKVLVTLQLLQLRLTS